MALLKLVPTLSKTGLSTVLQHKFLDARGIFNAQTRDFHMGLRRGKKDESTYDQLESECKLTQYLSFL